MSEYWKSTPTYWCKHCSTYVKDTPLERRQHENTGKHQGNLKRFLRDIQNDHQREEREKNKAKTEIDRLNKIVGAVSSQSSSSGPSIVKKVTGKSSTAAPSAADQKRQWAQLAEMGIKVPGSAQADMAIASEWTTVQKPIEVSTTELEGSHSTGVRKRKFGGQEEEEEAGAVVVRKGWGSTTKRYPGADDDLDDLLTGTLKSANRSTPSVAIAKPADESDTNKESLSHVKHETSEQGEQHIQPVDMESRDLEENTDTKSKIKAEDGESNPVLASSKVDRSEAPLFKRRKAKSATVKKDSG